MKSKITLAVIPCRGGSKRLPRKNIRLLNGKPLIGYTIDAAMASCNLTHHIVSSEDTEIIEVAKKLGGNVPFKRPVDISGDNIRNTDTMLHAAEYFISQFGYNPDAVVLLQPTSPFRRSIDIDNAIEKFYASDANTCVSVTGPHKKRDVVLKRMDMASGRLLDYRENDDNPGYYKYNAAIYVVNFDYLKKFRSFTSKNETCYIMEEINSIDIDTELDFVMAEAIIKKCKETIYE